MQWPEAKTFASCLDFPSVLSTYKKNAVIWANQQSSSCHFSFSFMQLVHCYAMHGGSRFRPLWAAELEALPTQKTHCSHQLLCLHCAILQKRIWVPRRTGLAVAFLYTDKLLRMFVRSMYAFCQKTLSIARQLSWLIHGLENSRKDVMDFLFQCMHLELQTCQYRVVLCYCVPNLKLQRS